MYESYLTLTDRERERFDALLDRHVASLPAAIRQQLDVVPLIVDDEADPALLDELDIDDDGELCGLHWGIPLTDRSVEHSGALPDTLRLFRGPIIRVAEQRAYDAAEGKRPGAVELVEELDRQVRITLLHEIGHHFGLDEDDLTRLGYG